MDFKRYYEQEIAKRPALVPYVQNLPTYGDKLEYIQALPFMQRQTLAEDLPYAKDYTMFLDKHVDELQTIHPLIWEYINEHQTSGPLLKRLKDLAKLLAMPREESNRIVDTWFRRRQINRIIEEEDYYNAEEGYYSNNSYRRLEYNR
jgi:hypothetical protein